MGVSRMCFSTRLCESHCSMDIGKMLKLSLSPYFGPWWEIMLDIRIHAEPMSGPTNCEFLLTVTVGVLKTPAF